MLNHAPALALQESVQSEREDLGFRVLNATRHPQPRYACNLRVHLASVEAAQNQGHVLCPTGNPKIRISIYTPKMLQSFLLAPPKTDP